VHLVKILRKKNHQKKNLGTSQEIFFHTLITSVCKKLIEISEQLNEIDRAVGDGDCGDTFHRGATRVLENAPNFEFEHPAKWISQIGDSISLYMGGTSGAILDIFFRAMSVKLSQITQSKKNTEVSPEDWCSATQEGIDAIIFYGGATPGMRTLLDALVPALAAARTALS